MSLDVVYSTLSAPAIAALVEQHYGLGAIAACHLVKRGFNDVYVLTTIDGTRWIARLADLRARGPSNIAYETAFIAHLKACGLTVSAAVPGNDGALWREVAAPEGARAFAVFEFLSGQIPVRTVNLVDHAERALEDLKALGASHARMHEAGLCYAGPPSLFRLEADHLLRAPLARLLGSPGLDPDVREGFAAIGQRLERELTAVAPDLSIVACHGDNHGGNTFMAEGPNGARTPAWFDFDEAAPGYLAYDLAVLPWSMYRRVNGATLNATALGLWAAFLDGYRSVRPIPTADFEAIGLFVQVRNIWLWGEFASRVPEWGTEAALDPDWLAGQVKVMAAWEGLKTPAGEVK